MVKSIKLAYNNYVYRKQVQSDKYMEAEKSLENARRYVVALRETLTKLIYDDNS